MSALEMSLLEQHFLQYHWYTKYIFMFEVGLMGYVLYLFKKEMGIISEALKSNDLTQETISYIHGNKVKIRIFTYFILIIFCFDMIYLLSELLYTGIVLFQAVFITPKIIAIMRRGY